MRTKHKGNPAFCSRNLYLPPWSPLVYMSLVSGSGSLIILVLFACDLIVCPIPQNVLYMSFINLAKTCLALNCKYAGAKFTLSHNGKIWTESIVLLC